MDKDNQNTVQYTSLSFEDVLRHNKELSILFQLSKQDQERDFWVNIIHLSRCGKIFLNTFRDILFSA